MSEFFMEMYIGGNVNVLNEQCVCYGDGCNMCESCQSCDRCYSCDGCDTAGY